MTHIFAIGWGGGGRFPKVLETIPLMSGNDLKGAWLTIAAGLTEGLLRSRLALRPGSKRLLCTSSSIRIYRHQNPAPLRGQTRLRQTFWATRTVVGCAPKSGSHLTRCWREMDSDPRSP